MTQQEIRERIHEMTEPEYQKFSQKLLPGVEGILGVRLGELRKLARKIAKEDYTEYVQNKDFQSFEETMLHGMVLGYIDADIDTLRHLIDSFLPYIDNWSVCDSFCSSLKITKKYQQEMWLFIQQHACSEQEFEARFAAVMLLNYYIQDDWIQKVLQLYINMKQSGYYTQMAVAWGLSMCYVSYPDLTIDYLKPEVLDSFVYRKTLQKITESNQITVEHKSYIRSLLKKYQS